MIVEGDSVTTDPVPSDGAMRPMQDRLHQLAQRAEQRTRQFAQVREQIDGLTVSERSPDGAVRVTVQASGALSDLTLTDAASRLRPDQIATEVMRCIRSAQSRIADRVGTVVAENVSPDDPAGQHIVGRFRDQFPEPEPEPAPRNELRFGPTEPEAAARPARPARPGPAGDDGWDDRPIMR